MFFLDVFVKDCRVTTYAGTSILLVVRAGNTRPPHHDAETDIQRRGGGIRVVAMLRPKVLEGGRV